MLEDTLQAIWPLIYTMCLFESIGAFNSLIRDRGTNNNTNITLPSFNNTVPGTKYQNTNKYQLTVQTIHEKKSKLKSRAVLLTLAP